MCFWGRLLLIRVYFPHYEIHIKHVLSIMIRMFFRLFYLKLEI